MLGRKRPRRLPDLVRSSVALHLVGGRTLAGRLLGEYEDGVSLSLARVETDEGTFQPADGEIFVRHDRIEWSQFGISLDDSEAVGELRSLPARDLRGTSTG